jgi:hypothetical protein
MVYKMLKSWIITNIEVFMPRIPTHRPPTHPSELLLEDFLLPLGMTQQALAERLLVPTRVSTS